MTCGAFGQTRPVPPQKAMLLESGLAMRPQRRVSTAPCRFQDAFVASYPNIASVPSSPDIDMVAGEMVLPNTSEVRRQLAIGGISTTPLDIALGIVGRLLKADTGHDQSELRFLRDCLQADPARTSMPCGLLCSHDDSDDELNDDLDVRTWLRSYSCQGDELYSPTSSRATSRHPSLARSLASRKPSLALSEASEVRKGLPRWPANLEAERKATLAALLDEFDSWSFDIFSLSELTCGRPLQFAGWEAFLRGGHVAKLDLSAQKAIRFLQRVEGTYAPAESAPYHNSMHAADVTQLVHSMLGDIGFGECFDSLNCLTLVLGAVVHDMGHDGRNNQFHVNAQDELALTYNDRSVLENFHISQAFRLLACDQDADILSDLGPEMVVRARKEMIEVVLATDMAQHFCQVSNLKHLTEKLGADPEAWCSDTSARSALQAMVLHAADIATPAKPAALSDLWTECLKQELFMQGDEEKRLSMPVSPLCDRDTVKFASSQVSFIQYVVQPCFELLAVVCPSVESVVLTELASNTAMWDARKKAEEDEAQPRIEASRGRHMSARLGAGLDVTPGVAQGGA